MLYTMAEHPQGKQVRVEARSMNFLDTQKLKELFDALLDSDLSYLELDLNEVYTVDSSVVGMFLSYYKKFSEKGKRFKIGSVSLQLKGILKLMKVDRLMEIN